MLSFQYELLWKATANKKKRETIEKIIQ